MTREEYEARQRAFEAELDQLEAITPEAELEKRFFVNHGCINFRSDEFFHELNLARIYHERQMKRHPGKHTNEVRHPYSCYTEYCCKHCSFSEAVDSSG